MLTLRLTGLADAWAQLRARPAAALVAYGTLALSLALCLLAALLAHEQAASDTTLPAPERIVLLDFKPQVPGRASEWAGASPLFFGPALKARGVALEHIARTRELDLTLRTPAGVELVGLLAADAELVPLMGLRAAAGDLAASLSRPHSVAIDTDLVRVLWGDLPPAQAIGRTLQAQGRVFEVHAVFAPLGTRHPLFGRRVLAGFTSAALQATREQLDAVFDVNGRVFARLPGGVPAARVGAWMGAALRDAPGYAQLPAEWTADGRDPAQLRALPLPEARWQGGDNARRWALLAAVAAAATVLLLMATINAANLQGALMLQRRRETALRRCLGAGPAQLLLLWATEVGTGVLLASGAAWLLAWWAAPGLIAALGLPPRTDLFGALPAAWVWASVAVSLLLVPVIAALPAAYALRAVPARALQGRTASDGPAGRRVRQALLATQLGAALLLLSFSAVLAVQHRHLQQMDHGYRLDGRLLLDVWAEPNELARLQPLLDTLARDASVKAWAFSSAVPGGGWGGPLELYRRSATAAAVPLRMTRASSGFFAAYAIPVVAGALPAQPRAETSVVLDAHATRALGFASPQAAVGALLLAADAQPRRVVAVVADVKLESAREPAQPQSFVLDERIQPFLTLHGGDPRVLRDTVAALWKQHALTLYYRFDEVAEQRRIAYGLDALLAALLGTLALLAAAVAAVGAYALVADTLRRRRAEIVLRRLHGGGAAAITRTVFGEFVAPALAALLVAMPAGALLSALHLSSYVDRAPLMAGVAVPMLLAALVMLGVIVLAAATHTRRALALRPVQALA